MADGETVPPQATTDLWARIHPAQRIVFQDYMHATQDAEKRRDALTEQIRKLIPEWSMAPVVAASPAMRGVAMVIAVTLVAEVGDLTRFNNPRDLMSHLGLVPSEHSSGATTRRSSITKTGNVEARRVMIEAAWTYRLPARVGRILLDRLEGVPVEIRDIACKAQVRLCARYRRLPPRANLFRSSWRRSLANCWGSPGPSPVRSAPRSQPDVPELTTKGAATHTYYIHWRPRLGAGQCQGQMELPRCKVHRPGRFAHPAGICEPHISHWFCGCFTK